MERAGDIHCGSRLAVKIVTEGDSRGVLPVVDSGELQLLLVCIVVLCDKLLLLQRVL